jgi:anti-anti-sigma factor
MKPPLDPNERTVTLCVPGDLISTNVETFRNEADVLLETDAGTSRPERIFILDLTAAKMVDSAGLNLVVSLLKRVQRQGAKMQIRYSSPNILRTFNFTRLDKHIELVKA